MIILLLNTMAKTYLQWRRIYLFLIIFAWTLLITISTDQIYTNSSSGLNTSKTTINDNDPSRAADPNNIKPTTRNSNKAIDWTQVEEKFNQYLSDEEILQKWETMEANMKSGIKSLLRNIFPKIAAMASDAKVSNECSAGILKWIVSIRHMKSWALKMLDAMGKPPSGIFEGVVTMFGNYDECLKIRVFHEDNQDDDGLTSYDSSSNMGNVEFFRGQYCITEFKPWLPKKPNFYGINTQYKLLPDDDTMLSEFVKMSLFFHFITFRIDICVPSTCSKEDMQKIATLMANLAEFRARVLRCEMEKNDTSLSSDWWIFWITVLALTFTLISTIIDLSASKEKLLKIKFFRIFSITNSWKQFSQIKSNELNPLYGLRVAILIWIITVHTFIIVDFQFFREMQTLKSWASKWPSQILTNSLFQFDCFILITAFTFGYCNIHNSKKQLLEFILNRYLKLVILMIFVIFITFLIPHLLFHGPLTQDFLPKLTQSFQCRNNLWKSFLFLQNYCYPDCLIHTWIFCVEFQLMMLMTPLLIIQNRHQIFKWIFWLALPVFMAIGFLYNFFTVYNKRLPPTYYWTLPDKEQRQEYFIEYYYKPWAHLSVFVIGFYAGVYRKLSNKCKKSFLLNRNFTYLGYIFSLGIIFSFTFGFHDWITKELPNRLISALYNSFQNIALSMAYCWIMFSITGHSSCIFDTFLNRIFNTRLMILLGKLTISGYLILPLVQTFLLASQQQHLYSSNILMLYVIIGNIVLIYSFAVSLSLLMEIPIRLILSSLFNYLLNYTNVKNNVMDNEKTKNNSLSSRNINSIELSLNK